MALRDRQVRWTRVGAIRLGEQVPTGKMKDGKPTFRPSKLETFRVTSPSQRLVESVQKIHGGTVRPWQSPTGPEFEVITAATEMAVLVPPQKIDPFYEFYDGRHLARRCDGVTETKRQAPCLCKQGDEGHVHDFEYGQCTTCPVRRACKSTTRLSLMIADAQGLGTFKLESHGDNAADELPMLSAALEQANREIPATLLADKRSITVLLNAGRPNEKVEKRNYVVPVLIFDWLTPAQAFGGQIGAAAQAALTGSAPQVAIESKAATNPAEPAQREPEKLSAGQVLALAKLVKSIPELQRLWHRANESGVLTDAVKAELKGYGEAIEKKNAPAAKPAQSTPAPAAKPAAKPAPAAKPEPPVAEVVDAEIVEDEPDSRAVWNEVVNLAADQTPRWSMTTLAEKFIAFTATADAPGYHYNDDKATGWVFAKFRDAVKAGEVR
jgi:hypothetical protein